MTCLTRGTVVQNALCKLPDGTATVDLAAERAEIAFDLGKVDYGSGKPNALVSPPSIDYVYGRVD